MNKTPPPIYLNTVRARVIYPRPSCTHKQLYSARRAITPGASPEYQILPRRVVENHALQIDLVLPFLRYANLGGCD